MSEYREPLHPRPQLARREWIDLGGVWGFAYDDDRRGLDEGWQEREDPFSCRSPCRFHPSPGPAESASRASIPSSDIAAPLMLRRCRMASGCCSTSGRWTTGRPYFLRMALAQGYWPESHLTAPSDEALRREVELAKELGFNGIRIHQKIEDPRFLYWCDRLGLMAWEEMPSAYVFSTAAMQRLVDEWLNVIARDASHPCIVAWVPLNESWGVPNMARDVAQQHFVQTMYHLTKALDPTRPAIGNDGWEHLVGDIFGVHDYSFDGSVLRARYGNPEALERTLLDVQPHHHAVLLPGYRRAGEPIMVMEFGGISYKPSSPGWFGYMARSAARRSSWRNTGSWSMPCSIVL